MKCLNPTTVYRCGKIPSKRDGVISDNLVFSENKALAYYISKSISLEHAYKLLNDNSYSLPCGKCLQCQMRKRKDMTVRLANEVKCHEDVCFLTLTYDDDHIPLTNKVNFDSPKKSIAFGRKNAKITDVPTLVVSDVQRFIKRLRRHLDYIPKSAKKRLGRDHVSNPIRYFVVGEYGTKFSRPHYHIIIFGWAPSDKSFFFMRNGSPVYRSVQLEKLWTFGYSTVQDVSTSVAKYCARYVTKKYIHRDIKNSDFILPEFTLQSLRYGGIGAPWCDKYGANACAKGFVGVKIGCFHCNFATPKYYYDRLRRINLPLWISLRNERMEFLATHKPKSVKFEELLNECNKYCYDERKRDEQAFF